MKIYLSKLLVVDSGFGEQKARGTFLLSVNLQGVVSSLETTVEMLKADSGLDRNRAEFLAAMESDKVGSETLLRIRIRIRRIRMFLGLLDSDPDPSITKQKY